MVEPYIRMFCSSSVTSDNINDFVSYLLDGALASTTLDYIRKEMNAKRNDWTAWHMLSLKGLTAGTFDHFGISFEIAFFEPCTAGSKVEDEDPIKAYDRARRAIVGY